MTGPAAIPVRVLNRPWRTLVIEADPEFVTEAENPVEYEFTAKKNGKREFRGRYKSRGAYAE